MFPPVADVRRTRRPCRGGLPAAVSVRSTSSPAGERLHRCVPSKPEAWPLRRMLGKLITFGWSPKEEIIKPNPKKRHASHTWGRRINELFRRLASQVRM